MNAAAVRVKKHLLLLLLVVTCTAQAQPDAPDRPLLRRHEFRLSVGAYSMVTDAFNVNTHSFDINIPSWGEEFDTTKEYKGAITTSCAVALAYDYRIGRLFDMGVALAYTNVGFKRYSNVDGSVIEKIHTHHFSILPTARLTWLNRRSVRLYSSCSLGIDLIATNSNKTHKRVGVAGQFSPFGIAVGRSLFGFAEVGVGTQGSLIVGLGYAFNPKK